MIYVVIIAHIFNPAKLTSVISRNAFAFQRMPPSSSRQLCSHFSVLDEIVEV